MMKRLDLAGQRFGHLIVVAFSYLRNSKAHWLCVCACGTELTVLAASLRRGATQSCGCQSSRTRFSGSTNPRWNGGRRATDGYILTLAPSHPRANKNGYVPEHILVAERALGRPLPEQAIVHHVNEDRLDNRSANLVICQDNAFHMRLHLRARAFRATGNPDMRKCAYCGQWDTPEHMKTYTYQKSGQTFRHLACLAAYGRERRNGMKQDALAQ